MYTRKYPLALLSYAVACQRHHRHVIMLAQIVRPFSAMKQALYCPMASSTFMFALSPSVIYVWGLGRATTWQLRT